VGFTVGVVLGRVVGSTVGFPLGAWRRQTDRLVREVHKSIKVHKFLDPAVKPSQPLG
jgi:hypothetical protein